MGMQYAVCNRLTKDHVYIYIYIYMTWEDMHNMFILIFGEDSLRKQNRAIQIAWRVLANLPAMA